MTTKVKHDEPENALLASLAPQTVNEYIWAYFRRVRSGDIGALPIIFGMVIVALIFQSQNQNFLTPRNLVNLIVQMSAITTIGYGIVFVLLLGEIDLSVGFVGGMAAVSMTLALKGTLSPEMATVVAVLFALAVAYFVWSWFAPLKVNALQDSTLFSMPDFAALIGAVVLAGAFWVLPWFTAGEAGDITGASLLATTSDVYSTIALWFIPVAALFGGIAALRGILDANARHQSRFVTGLLGALGLGYFVLFFVQAGRSDIDVTPLLGLGFWIALLASGVLLLLAFLPRPMGAGDGKVRLILQRFRLETVIRIVLLVLVFVICATGVTSILTQRPLLWYEGVTIALIAAAGIGLMHGTIITFFDLPAFVVTLAGLLAWQGVVLIFIGGAGTVILQDQTVLGVANTFLPAEVGWFVAIAFVGAFSISEFLEATRRQRLGLSFKPYTIIGMQALFMGLLAAIAVWICNQDRGVPLIGVGLILMMIGLSFVATRTRFGRYVFAVGGNTEAARRAGINVAQIRVHVFMIASLMAGMGGIILASRLRSVDTNAGGGQILLNSIAAAVIGGTSLFGGSGKISSAIMGAIIIASVDNGMGLLGLSAGAKFIITALVLLAAVVVDALARRSQKQSGIR